MYKTILLVFIAAASCGTPKEASENTSGNETPTPQIQNRVISLALGEKAMVGDLTIHFKEVLEDSRCPMGTTCVWQGRAKILVETKKNSVERDEIIFGVLKDGETKNHNFYTSEQVTLTATGVEPYPTKESGTTNLNYVLLVDVSAN
jgi:hypothetical protein